MIRFLAQRLLRALLVLLGVSVLAFILIDLGIALIPIFLLYNALADALMAHFKPLPSLPTINLMSGQRAQVA